MRGASWAKWSVEIGHEPPLNDSRQFRESGRSNDRIGARQPLLYAGREAYALRNLLRACTAPPC